MDKKIASTILIVGGLIGSVVTSSINNTEAGTVLEKHSATEVKITTTDVQEAIVSLDQLKQKIAEANVFKAQYTQSCALELHAQDKRIERLNELIEEAESKGVVESKEKMIDEKVVEQ